MRRRLYLMTSVLAIASFSLLFAAGCASTPASTPQPASPSPTTKPAAKPTTAAAVTPAAASANGEQLYKANCAACHGANGAGGTKIGKATAADLRQPKLEPGYHNDTTLLRRAIVEGKDEKGGDLDEAMPRFKGKLSDSNVDAIVTYLKTLR
ncbi:MAG: cytochrome c [Chloroflexi bacterium]|nr:cytochrome c [Chloroflexota bacterium]